MNHYLVRILLIALCCAGISCRMHSTNTKPLLLTESNLEAWDYYLDDSKTKMSDVWRLEDGVLICSGSPLGYLYTKQPYKNFTLKLEWRWQQGKHPGKGGVLIRMTGEHKIWPKSLEAQINNPDAGDFWGLDGYELSGDPSRSKTLNHDRFGKLTNLKKTKALEKAPGLWNTYEIRAQGDIVTLIINGEEVNRTTKCETEPGRICLTSEGHEIHFRNITLEAFD